MLSKDKRLNLRKDFKWVAQGSRFETKYLKIFVNFGDNQIPKVGIAVSSKSFKKASERNRARRITTAAFEAVYGSLPKGANILTLPKSGVIRVKSGEVLADLEEGLKKEKIL